MKRSFKSKMSFFFVGFAFALELNQMENNTNANETQYERKRKKKEEAKKKCGLKTRTYGKTRLYIVFKLKKITHCIGK